MPRHRPSCVHYFRISELVFEWDGDIGTNLSAIAHENGADGIEELRQKDGKIVESGDSCHCCDSLKILCGECTILH